MTKMIKMSLIAAVAVTGMTSTVCAQPLEDAIKGVDVSGMLRYRYDDTHVKNATSSTQVNEYTMKIATKAKVNDMVTANVQVEALGVNTGAVGYESAHATNDTTGDRDVNLAVTKANFAANLGVATVVAGKQSVPSPFVDNYNDDLTRGTGAVALIPVAGQTIAAGHFMNFQTAEGDTSAAAKNYGSSIDAIAAIGSVAGINYDAWYVKVNGTAANTATTALADTTAKSLGLNTEIAGIKLDGRISTVARDALGSTAASDSKLSKLVASTKVGPVTVTAGAAFTPKNNVNTTLDGDNDSKSGFRLWQASTEALNNSSAYLVGAKMEVMPGVTFSADYVTAKADIAAVSGVTAVAAVYSGAVDTVTGLPVVTTSAVTAVTAVAAQKVDISELLLGATYQMSKNFSVHARYSMMKADYSVKADVDTNKGRLEIKYTF